MIRRLVLDASAALHAVLPGPAAERVLDTLAAAGLVLAPDLYCLEVGNALWKYVRAGDVTAEEAIGRLEHAVALVDTLTPVSELAKEALVMAAATHLTVYDCAYAVLARREGATLLTADLSLANALEKLKSPVVAVKPGESAKNVKRSGSPRRRS